MLALLVCLFRPKWETPFWVQVSMLEGTIEIVVAFMYLGLPT
jgi:hypothetical protein